MSEIRISDEFLDEIKLLFVEGEFNHRWTLIETYHTVGQMICTRLQGNRGELLQALSPQIGKSVRTLWYATKFYDTFPDLNMLPEGKNISMNKVITKYLTTSKQEECTHPEDHIETISFKVCKDCKKHLGKVEENHG